MSSRGNTPTGVGKTVDMKFITHQTGLTDKWFYKLKSEVEQWLQARIDESRT